MIELYFKPNFKCETCLVRRNNWSQLWTDKDLVLVFNNEKLKEETIKKIKDFKLWIDETIWRFGEGNEGKGLWFIEFGWEDRYIVSLVKEFFFETDWSWFHHDIFYNKEFLQSEILDLEPEVEI